MPDLDDIFQTGQPVPKADLKQYLEDLTPSPDDETGVINVGYRTGDVRRYGVFPDATTDWANTNPDRIAAILANSCVDGIEVFWPRGHYATSINLGADHDGSRMYFDNAVFGGILHLTSGVSDVNWRGEVSTYDRFGITAGGSDNIRLPIIHCLSDATKNIATVGAAGRGVHIQDTSNLYFEMLDVEDCGAASASLPGSTGNLAAVWLECQGYSGIRGRIRVRNSQTNGVFINGLDIDLDIRVDGYGNAVIDTGIVPLAGLSLTQTQLGSGVIFQRCTGRARVYIDQSNASPAADIYPLVIGETGLSTTAATRHQPLIIENLYATVGDSNRGVCIGTAEDKYAICNVVFTGGSHIRKRGTDSLASNYAGLNVLSPATTANHYRRFVSSGMLSFSNFVATLEFQAQAVASPGLDNFTEVVIEEFSVEATSGGTISLVGNAGTGGILMGSIGFVRIYWTGGSSTTPSIDMSECTNFNIRGGSLRGATQITATAIAAAGCLNCVIAPNLIYNYGHNSNGALAVNAGNKRCTFGPTELVRAGAITSSAGVKFSGTQEDCIFQGLVLLTSFSVGFENGTSMAFTRCAAIQCVADGNTDNTDLATSDFPAANQLACTNFAV